MILLGIDPATCTGWCAYEPLGMGRDPRIECGSFRCEGDNDAQMFASVALECRDLIKRFQPRRVAIELPISSVASVEKPIKGDMFGGKKRQSIRTDRSVTVQVGVRTIILACIGMPRPSAGMPNGIPYEEPAMRTWRASFFGAGTAPPASVPKDKRSAWWKRLALEHARLLGDKMGFEVANHNEAEAVAIAFWLAAHAAHFDARDRVAA